MSTPDAHDLVATESELLEPPAGEFSDEEIEGLADPVRRYFRASIRPGTPLARSAILQMRGRIRIGRWLPFVAREVLNPHAGFIWQARAVGVIRGRDYYAGGRGGLHWRLAGLVTVMHAEGTDIARSAASRAGGEAIWLPTSLLPRFGVEWSAQSDHRITAAYATDGHPIDLQIELTDTGLARAVSFDRWGDPTGGSDFRHHPFGAEIHGYREIQGMTIPARGEVGWNYGTPAWDEGGGFFRYDLEEMHLPGV